MKFACDGCGKKYVLSDGKIADKRNVRLKCKSCGELITVKRDGQIVVELITTTSLAPTASIVPSGPPPPETAESVPTDGSRAEAAAGSAELGAHGPEAVRESSAEPAAQQPPPPVANLEGAPSPGDTPADGTPGTEPEFPPPPGAAPTADALDTADADEGAVRPLAADVPPPPNAVFQVLDEVNASQRLPPLGSVSDDVPAAPAMPEVPPAPAPLAGLSSSSSSVQPTANKRNLIVVGAVGVVLLIVLIFAIL